MSTLGTDLWLIVHSHIPQINLQITRTLHHEATAHFVLGHFFFKSILRKPGVVKVVAHSSISNVVAVVVEVEGHVAVRRYKVERSSAGGGFLVGGGTVIEKEFGNILVTICHCPHQSTPLILILLVDIDASVDESLDYTFVALCNVSIIADAGLHEINIQSNWRR